MSSSAPTTETAEPPAPLTARDIRLKQLRFRAWRRGFREHDFIMGSFADRHIASLDEAGLDEFQALLDTADWDVYAWITGPLVRVPDDRRGPVLDLLRSFHHFAHTLWHGPDGPSTAQ
jgi:antitoxin CptB